MENYIDYIEMKFRISPGRYRLMMVNFGAKPKIEQIGNILKVSGIMMKVGTWTPSDGTVTKFDENSIAKLYAGIVENLPLWISHDGAGVSCRSPSGFSYKAGLVNNDTEIAWEGLIFNKAAIDDIVINGFDGNSIEVDLDLDPNGLVTDGHIIGNAFVKNPAVHDEVVEVEFVDLSSSRTFTAGDNSVTISGNEFATSLFADNTSGIVTDLDSLDSDSTDSKDLEENMPSKVQELLASLTSGELDELKSEVGTSADIPPVVDTSELDAALGTVAALEAENAKFKTQFEAIHKKKYESLVAKLVEFGIKDPASITEGLDVTQGIEVLSKFQEKLVKEKPAVEAGDHGTGDSTGGTDRGAKFDKLVKDEGLEDMVAEFLTGSE